MSDRKYAGTWTALITPFKNDGSLDEEAFRNLVVRQREAGVTGIVPVGTTGESPTLEVEEARRIFEIAVEESAVERSFADHGTDQKMMVMAGTGSNSTAKTVKMTKMAKELGVDACLIVTPYYNKPTPSGLIQHFNAVSDIGLPVLVYNIKGRSGINIETETLIEIAKHDSVIGVKEASGDLDQMRDVLDARDVGDLREDFVVLSGDDGLTLELMKMGGDGVVSVASNIVPDEVVEMVAGVLIDRASEDGVLGDSKGLENSEKLNKELAQMFEELFVETNPIPAKYLAHRMGLCELKYRLPMCEPTSNGKEVLENLIKKYNLV